MHSSFTRTWMATGGLAVAIAVGACDMNRDAGTVVPESDEVPVAAVTLTGCLQESDGELVLTMSNEPTGTPGAIGTSGTESADTSSPAAEHIQAAADAYRLEGDEASLRSHIGKQVRVMGTIEEQSEVAPRGATGSVETDRTGIDPGDLAALDVTAVEAVADTCG